MAFKTRCYLIAILSFCLYIYIVMTLKYYYDRNERVNNLLEKLAHAEYEIHELESKANMLNAKLNQFQGVSK